MVLTKKDILLLLCSGSSFLRSLHFFQDLGLDPGHGGIAGQLFGDQALILMPISVNIPSCSVRMFHSGSFSCRSKVFQVIS